MKYSISCLALSLYGLIVSWVMAQDTWSLDRCIDYAESHNLDLWKQQEVIAMHEDEVAMSRQSYLPTVTALLDNNMMFNQQSLLSINYPELMKSLHMPESSDVYALQAEINLSVPLYDGGRRKARIAHDKAQLRSSQLDRQNTFMGLQVTIAEAYLRVLYQREVADLAASQVAFYEEMNRCIEKKIEAGVGKEIDLKQNQTKLASARYQEVLAKNEIKKSSSLLSRLIGRDGEEEMLLADSSLTSMMSLMRPSMASLPSLLQTDSHPMIASQQARIEAADHEVRLAQRQQLPEVSLNAGVGTFGQYYFDEAYSRHMYSFGKQVSRYIMPFVGIHVNIPIYNAGQNAGNVRKASHAKRLQQLAIESDRQQLSATIREAQDNILNAHQKYQAANDMVDASQASLKATQYAYEAGYSTLYDVNQSHLAYEEARKNLLQSQYEYLIANKILGYYLAF